MLDKSDPGDDVIARFRYQFCHVAINALKLLAEPEWAEFIICENFEDFILERHDGSFVAFQVKSRERHLSPFKLTDEAVEKSLARFIKLNRIFPGKFAEFVFATNHEMWTEKDDERNIEWLLEQVKSAPTIRNLRKTNAKRKAIEKLCDTAAADTDSVLAALKKTSCKSRREDIKTIERAVEHAVVECEPCKELQHKTVILLAEDFISAAFQASTKGRNTFAPALYAADADINAVFDEAALTGKKINRTVVEEIIAKRLVPSDEPLIIGDLVTQKRLPVGLSRMVQKMAAGGVQSIRINHTGDLVRSFEGLEIRWAIRFGRDKARAMVNDLLARTLTECVEAQVQAESTSSPYGSNQFAILKRNLEERYSRERDSRYGCKPDHLIGAAGILTQNCKVWWSEKFALLDEDI